MSVTTPRSRLSLARAWIDHVDAAIVRLAASRRHAALWAAAAKPPGSGRDAAREAEVLRHMGDEALAWGLPEPTARAIAQKPRSRLRCQRQPEWRCAACRLDAE